MLTPAAKRNRRRSRLRAMGKSRLRQCDETVFHTLTTLSFDVAEGRGVVHLPPRWEGSDAVWRTRTIAFCSRHGSHHLECTMALVTPYHLYRSVDGRHLDIQFPSSTEVGVTLHGWTRGEWVRSTTRASSSLLCLPPELLLLVATKFPPRDLVRLVVTCRQTSRLRHRLVDYVALRTGRSRGVIEILRTQMDDRRLLPLVDSPRLDDLYDFLRIRGRVDSAVARLRERPATALCGSRLVIHAPGWHVDYRRVDHRLRPWECVVWKGGIKGMWLFEERELIPSIRRLMTTGRICYGIDAQIHGPFTFVLREVDGMDERLVPLE